MSQLETYTTLSALWLALAWLPYLLDRIMVRGLIGAMANYDPAAPPQSPWAQRAMRAHRVAVEAFIGFAPLALIAMMRLHDDPYPGILAMTWFYAMLAHYIIYCLGITVIRTLAFVLAFAATVALALRLLSMI
ncbi:MAPEG family protein [Aquicoccus sp. G2-2]|uniref:MAPEG family protein n=1 Tax=Aquicoccus sp. G2-2 TaxID=3092120 RepID=UPI002ADFECD7|nr:MAPEG family protein [Aquicoccus sp. G2-2]MEA1115139.1 MAPEG family protein [Aquicoccus sp. G2-2]